jgi:hypothetical protein
MVAGSEGLVLISVLKVGSQYNMGKLSFKGFLQFPERATRNMNAEAEYVVYSAINIKQI